MKSCVIAAMVAACGSDDATPVDAAAIDAAPHIITADQPITLGGVVEGTLQGGAGDAVRILLTAPTPIDWNLHTHVGGTQVIEQQASVMAVDYTYTPTEASTWNITLLDNGSAPVTVHVELQLFGQMSWSGF